jgi:hypothetical protein
MIFVAAMSLAFSASAQDLLVKRNGEQLKVKVLKITKKKVEYVRQGTELPVYSLPISDIEYIEYPTGDRDTFGRKVEAATTTKEPEKWHGAVPTPDGVVSVEYKPQTQAEKEEQTPKRWHGAYNPPADKSIANAVYTPSEESATIYNIGDIYDKNGVKGVVVMLTDGGRHGLIMSLDEVCLVWSNLPRKRQKAVGATDRFDGEKNMQAVEKYIAENGLSWSNFPAFEWCRAKGEGWYLPSINELWSAGTMYLGGSRTASNRKFRKSFNESVEGAGGTPLSGVMIYHSSTEDKDAKYSLYSHMNSEAPYIQPGYKADDLFVRAFHKF